MSKQRTTDSNDMSQSYGYEKIDADQKQGRVNDVFNSVANRYDIMNDLMSFGVHRLWKDALVAKANLPKTRKWRALDLACGSGDIGFRLAKNSQQGEITFCDINPAMLQQAKIKAGDLQSSHNFVVANGEQLPFNDNYFDLCAIGFGIRNIANIDKSLKEILRVLKPAAQFICLEFSKVDMPLLDKLYETWSFNVIPKLGKAIVNDEKSYQYLVESIRKFPNQKSFAKIIEKAGFKRVAFRNLSGGIVALHSAWKI